LSLVVYRFEPRPVTSYHDFKVYKMAIKLGKNESSK